MRGRGAVRRGVVEGRGVRNGGRRRAYGNSQCVLPALVRVLNQLVELPELVLKVALCNDRTKLILHRAKEGEKTREMGRLQLSESQNARER
jgi:hypothetical protein